MFDLRLTAQWQQERLEQLRKEASYHSHLRQNRPSFRSRIAATLHALAERLEPAPAQPLHLR